MINDFIMSCLLQCHDFWVSFINIFSGFLLYYLTSFTICSFSFLSQPGPNGMLDDWEENLAIITANRTKGDDLVITHLGDCLWKEKYEVCIIISYLFLDSVFLLFCVYAVKYLMHNVYRLQLPIHAI